MKKYTLLIVMFLTMSFNNAYASILYSENFSASPVGWTNFSSWTASGGVYNANTPNYSGFWADWNNSQVHSDFYLQVDMKHVSGDQSTFGLIFRANGSVWDDSYFLYVRPYSQHMYLYKRVNGTLYYVSGSSSYSSHINANDAWNTIGINVVGNKIELYANGNYVKTITDSSHSSGYVGLWAYRNQHVQFDNFVIETPRPLQVPPVAQPITVSTNEDTYVDITLPGSDANGGDLIYYIYGDSNKGYPNHGSVYYDNQVRFYPYANQNGQGTFRYRIYDGFFYSDYETVTVYINPVNDAPYRVGTINSFSVSEDSSNTSINVSSKFNDYDISSNGDSLSYSVTGSNPIVVQPFINGNHVEMDYQPDQSGYSYITVTATDTGGLSTTQGFGVTVNPINDAPVALNFNAQSISQNDTKVIFSANDIENDPLSFQIVTPPANGQVIGTHPNLKYRSHSGYSGNDSFTFRAFDGIAYSNNATVSVDVLPSSVIATTAPGGETLTQTYADSWSGASDVVGGKNINLTSAYSDVQDSTTANGTAFFGRLDQIVNPYVSPPLLSIIPPNDTISCNSSRVYTVRISNASDIVGYRIAVNYDSSKISYAAGSADIVGTSVEGDFDSLTVNDTIPGQLIFTNASDSDALSPGPATLMTFEMNFGSGLDEGDQIILSFDPLTNMNDGSIEFSTVELVETVNDINDRPTFDLSLVAQSLEDVGEVFFSNFATNISAGDEDESGQVLTFIVEAASPTLFATQPQILPNGTLIYSSTANAYGISDATVYLMDDGGAAGCGINLSTPQFFTIEVDPVNDAPTLVLGSDQFINEDDPPQTISGFAGFTAGPLNESTQTVSFMTTTDNEALFASLPHISSTGELTYTPALNANGSAIITTALMDDGGTANEGIDTVTETFQIFVFAVNDEPTIDPIGTVDILEDSEANIVNVTGITDGDPELDQPLTSHFSFTNPALIESATFIYSASNPFGSVEITPATDEFGTSVFTLSLQDNDSNLSPNDNIVSTSFIVNVSPVNDAPAFIVGASQNILNVTGSTRTVVDWATGIIAGPTNEANQLLSFTVETDQPGLFSVAPAVTPDGTLTFTPAPNAHGIVNVSLSIQDNGGTEYNGINTSATGSFTVTSYTPFLWGDLNVDDVSGTVDASLILRFDAALLPTKSAFGEIFQEFPGYPIEQYPEYYQPRAGVLPFPSFATFPLEFPPAANIAGNDNEAGVLDAAQLLRVAALLDDFVQSDTNLDGIGPDQPIFLTKQVNRSQVTPRSLLVDLSAERSGVVTKAFTAWKMNFFVDDGEDLGGFRIALDYDPAVVGIDPYGVEALSGAVIVVNDTQPGKLIVSGALIEIPGAGPAELLSVRMVSMSNSSTLIDSIKVDVDKNLTRLNDGAFQLSAQSVSEILLSESTDVSEWMILE